MGKENTYSKFTCYLSTDPPFSYKRKTTDPPFYYERLLKKVQSDFITVNIVVIFIFMNHYMVQTPTEFYVLKVPSLLYWSSD